MSIPTISYEDGEAVLDWIALTDALAAAHDLPRAEVADTFLYRGDDTLLTRSAWIDGLGVAVLRPDQVLAPMAVARLRPDSPRLQTEIAVAGYSYGGVLGAPTLTFGKLADLKGLRGETELARLDLAPLEGDAGGPVLDMAGGVLGMLLSPPSTGQRLPSGVSFAADAQALQNVLDLADLRAGQSNGSTALPPDDLTRSATGMTVLVSCWD